MSICEFLDPVLYLFYSIFHRGIGIRNKIEVGDSETAYCDREMHMSVIECRHKGIALAKGSDSPTLSKKFLCPSVSIRYLLRQGPGRMPGHIPV